LNSKIKSEEGRITIRGEGEGKNRATVSLPRQIFLKPIAPIAAVIVILQILIIHLPAPNFPIPVSTPHQPVPLIRNQTQRRRTPHRFPKRRTLLVASPRNFAFFSNAAPRRVQIFQVPKPHAALGSRPQLRLSGNNAIGIKYIRYNNTIYSK